MTKRPRHPSQRVRRGLSYDPYDHADQLDIEVVHRPIRHANGMWLPDYRLIVIRSGMRRLHDRSTLAHELAHAMLGHHDDRPKHEKQADAFAAELLIHPEECEDAMRYARNMNELSLELQVSTRILGDWLTRRAA